MTNILYKTEVGVLLPKEHPEYNSYSHVYTKDYGFYDEEARVFESFPEAKNWGLVRLESGANMTYAVITSDSYNSSEVNSGLIAELLSGETCPDSSWNFGHTEDDMLYFAHKEDGKIIARQPAPLPDMRII